MSDRIPCCVPFCKRTAPKARWPHAFEWICSKHWRLVDLDARRLNSAYLRRERKGKPVNSPTPYWHWQRCKRQAIEAAMGLR
jgi:hypothetical protein